MASWSTQATTDLQSFKTMSSCTNAEYDTLRKDVAAWADMIGRQRRKTFMIRNYRVTALAENHEVLSLTMDM